jgi:hypothetical protein
MNEAQKDEIRKLIREEFMKLIPEFFGKTLVQLKRFFISNIN